MYLYKSKHVMITTNGEEYNNNFLFCTNNAFTTAQGKGETKVAD